MYDKDTVVFTYTADVNFEQLSKSSDPVNGTYKYGTIEETSNGVSVQSDEDTEPDTDTYSLDHQITVSSVSKGAATAGDIVNGKRTLNWSMNVNQERHVSVKGVPITDSIIGDPENRMTYSGEGVTVIKRDRTQGWDGGTSEFIPWSDSRINKTADGKSWTFTPQDEGIYWYEIKYTTEVDVSDQIVDYSVVNHAEDEYGSSDGPGTAAPEDGKRIGIEKRATHYDKATQQISWEISIDVPPAGLDKAVLTDVFPTVWYGGESLWDTLVGTAESNITVSGLRSGDTYTITPDTFTKTITDPETSESVSETYVKGFEITFRKPDGENGMKDGLTGNPLGKYTVTVSFSTSVNEEWFDAVAAGYSTEYNHINTAKLEYEPGKTIEDSDTVIINPVEPAISKSAKDTSASERIIWKYSDHQYLPAWKYYITLTGITDDAFETVNPDGTITAHDLIITDTYNSTYLTMLDAAGRDPDIRIYDEENWRTYNGCLVPVTDVNTYDYTRAVKVADGSVPGTITFTIKKDDLPKRSNGMYYNDYRLEYTLYVKDRSALNELIEAAANENEGIFKLGNKAVWEGVGSPEINVEYEEQIVTKEATAGALNEETGTYDIYYTIKINQKGYQIGDDPYIEATDAYSNISIDYTTVSCTPPDALIEMRRQSASGPDEQDQVIFVLKNATPITITYKGSARQSGTYRNTITVNGQQRSTEGEWIVESGGSVTSHDYKITLLKHDGDNVLKRLSGAKFNLYRCEDEGPDTLLIEGMTTDADGQILIDNYVGENGEPTDLVKDQKYYVIETQAPVSSDGVVYEIEMDDDNRPRKYEFTISDHAEYGNQWIFLNNDVLAIRNWPKEEDNIELKIKKLWEGTGEAEMPESVTVHLYRKTDRYSSTGTLVQDITLSASNVQSDGSWAVTISGLEKSVTIDDEKKDYYYYIVEDPVSGFEVVYSDNNTLGLKNSGTLSMTNKKISITTNKIWQDENGEEITDQAVLATLPDVIIYLYKVGDNEPVRIATLSAADGYTVTWTGLDSGYTYYVQEEKDEYDNTAGGRFIGVTYVNENGTTVTNLSGDGTATVINRLQSVTVKKVWDDDQGRPMSAAAITEAGLDQVIISANLLNSSGEVVKTAELSAQNNWEVTWRGLDFRETYTVEEDPVNGYSLYKIVFKDSVGNEGFNDSENENTWTVYENPLAGGSIELHNMESVPIEIKKVWPDGEDTTASSALYAKVRLYSIDPQDLTYGTDTATIDNEKAQYVGEYILNAANNWTVTIEDGLDRSKYYFVEERECSDGFALSSIVYHNSSGGSLGNLNHNQYYVASYPVIPYAEDTGSESGIQGAVLTNIEDTTHVNIIARKEWQGEQPTDVTDGSVTVKLQREVKTIASYSFNTWGTITNSTINAVDGDTITVTTNGSGTAEILQKDGTTQIASLNTYNNEKSASFIFDTSFSIKVTDGTISFENTTVFVTHNSSGSGSSYEDDTEWNDSADALTAVLNPGNGWQTKFSGLDVVDGNKQYRYYIKEISATDADGISYNVGDPGFPYQIITDDTSQLENDSGYADTAGTTQTLSVENKRAELKSHAEVGKTLSGRDWRSDDTFTFTLSPRTDDHIDGENGVSTSDAVTAGIIVLPDIVTASVSAKEKSDHTGYEADGSGVFGDIIFKQAGTYTFVITENNGEIDGITYSQKKAYVKFVVTRDDETGKLSMADPVYAVAVDDTGTEITELSYDAAVPSFTNSYISLDVLKVAAGTTTPLDDAKFQMYRKLSGEESYTVFENEAFEAVKTTENDQNVTKNTGPFEVDGSITITGLLAGDYQLKEVQSPTGYVNTVGDIEFTINADGTISGTAPSLVTYVSKSDTRERSAVSVGNEPGAALPATGGLGTDFIYAAAITLLSFAAFGLLMRRRREVMKE